MATLYELTGEYAGLLAQLNAAETDDEAAAIWQIMDGLQMDISVKAEAYARMIKNKEAEAAAFEKEAERLTALHDKAQAQANKMRESIRVAMIACETDTIPTTIGTWKTKLNPVKCDVVDIKKVPMTYLKKIEPPEFPFTVDKKKANADFMLTGEIIPGLNIERKIGISFK